MPKVPGVDRARIEPAKLRDYLLSDVHPVGRSKELFFRMLGYARTNAWQLERDLRELLARSDAVIVGESEYGTKYLVSGRLRSPSGESPPVVTIWIVRHGESAPRFVTAYPETWP